MSASIADIISRFNTGGEFYTSEIIKEGIINSSYLVTVKCGDRLNKFFLQKINTGVFTNPYALADNIDKICSFQRQNSTQAAALSVIKTMDGRLLCENGGYWRCLTYIDNTYTIHPTTPNIDFFEAGAGIGKFHRSLLSFPVEELEITIPGFHDTAARISKLLSAIKSGNQSRVCEAAEVTEFAESRIPYATELLRQIGGCNMPVRVVHNDTNLNNILFDKVTGKSVCMIDLDTTMPGLLIHDYGDAARHCLLTMKDKNGSIDFRSLSRLTCGFMSETGDFITENEFTHFFSGLWLITYELGLRFLTDYFENDVYFRIQNEKDNLNDAKRQLALLGDIDANKDEIIEAIKNYKLANG
jgi:thiamine kinase-like enzyme